MFLLIYGKPARTTPRKENAALTHQRMSFPYHGLRLRTLVSASRFPSLASCWGHPASNLSECLHERRLQTGFLQSRQFYWNLPVPNFCKGTFGILAWEPSNGRKGRECQMVKGGQTYRQAWRGCLQIAVGLPLISLHPPPPPHPTPTRACRTLKGGGSHLLLILMYIIRADNHMRIYRYIYIYIYTLYIYIYIYIYILCVYCTQYIIYS